MTAKMDRKLPTTPTPFRTPTRSTKTASAAFNSTPAAPKKQTAPLASMSSDDFRLHLQRSIATARSLNNTSGDASDTDMMAKVTMFALEFMNRKGIAIEEVIEAMVAREYPFESDRGQQHSPTQGTDVETLKDEFDDGIDDMDFLALAESFELSALKDACKVGQGKAMTSEVSGQVDTIEIPSSV